MKSRKIDKMSVACLVMCFLLGVALVVSVIFFGDYLGDYHAKMQGLSMTAYCDRLIEKVGFKPMSVFCGIFTIGISVIGVLNKWYLVRDTESDIACIETEGK